MFKLFFVLLTGFCALPSLAQNIKDSIVNIPYVSFSYSPQVPGGDFGKRFGLTNNIAIQFGKKTSQNWIFELEGAFLFSKRVKEDSILDYLKTDEGYIIDQFGDAAVVLIFQRGFTETFMVGKLFPKIGSNANSGLLLKLGAGFMHHKIRIENQGDNVVALQKQNLVYVDRLTMGLFLKEYVGYYHFSSNKLTNFSIGLEVGQGFTKGMRDYQFGYGPYKENRFELLIGLRAGWTIPIYRKEPNEFYLD